MTAFPASIPVDLGRVGAAEVSRRASLPRRRMEQGEGPALVNGPGMRWSGQDEKPEGPVPGERRFERGGLPERVVARLRAQAARPGGHLFSSDLSVRELALAGAAGCEPLG